MAGLGGIVARKSISDLQKEQGRRTRVASESDVEHKYKLGNVLGKGSFGIVLEAKQLSTGQDFAIKVIQKERVSSTISFPQMFTRCLNEFAAVAKVTFMFPLFRVYVQGPQMELIEREVSILQSMDHPHMIHLEEVFETPKVGVVGVYVCVCVYVCVYD